jgi:ethanolamine transporter EutH
MIIRHDLGYRNISDLMKNNLEMIYESFLRKLQVILCLLLVIKNDFIFHSIVKRFFPKPLKMIYVCLGS